MLSLRLKRSYEPLRLPTQASVLSLPYTRWSAVSPPPGLDLQHWATNLQEHADPATPGVDGATSVIPAPILRPSPSDHGVGFSTSFTRLLMGSLALRPALLLCGNSRPRVAATPLPHATGAYGQLPGRDFNPLDLLLLLRTARFGALHSERYPADPDHGLLRVRRGKRGRQASTGSECILLDPYRFLGVRGIRRQPHIDAVAADAGGPSGRRTRDRFPPRESIWPASP